MKRWEDLPETMRTPEVRPYYDALKKRRFARFMKRAFDIFGSLFLLILLSPLFLLLAVAIKLDSRGPVFFRQIRITRYGKQFRIHKFRSMAVGSDKGNAVTVKDDPRVTRVGRFIRRCRLDEISQLIDVLEGTMSFVGTRPEVPKYVDAYTPEMKATLLMPAGVTGLASIYYKDESRLLDSAEDVDAVYIERILPGKMKYNLRELDRVGAGHDLRILVMTVFAALGKDFKEKNEEEKEND
ncbi:MAG: sugar transferase [Clostridia bacterium]|nr:sugar transferase [Clostridia bacterium]